MMKLYMHPASTTSRPVSLFAAEAGIDIDEILVDILNGENRRETYLTLNPNGLVPLLDDHGFLLSESSAILKYLADKYDSPLYPRDLHKRARINEAMDWLNANLYRELGYNFVYPQLLPHYARQTEEGTRATIAWGGDKTRHWLDLMDRHLIGDGGVLLCNGNLTIADFFGSGIISLLEAVQYDLHAFPNIDRWLEHMKQLPHWERANSGFYQMMCPTLV